MPCVHVLFLEFASKSAQPKALNYIPTSCACAKFLLFFSNFSKFSTYKINYGDIPSISTMNCQHRLQSEHINPRGSTISIPDGRSEEYICLRRGLSDSVHYYTSSHHWNPRGSTISIPCWKVRGAHLPQQRVIR